MFCLCSVPNYFFLQNPKQARAEQEPLLCPPVSTAALPHIPHCWDLPLLGDPGHIKHPSRVPLSPVTLDWSSRETLGCLRPTGWPRKALEEKNSCFLTKLFLIAEVPFQNGASVGGCFGIITGYKPSLLVNGEFSCTYFSNKFLIFICTQFCSGCTHHVAHWEMMVWHHWLREGWFNTD